MAYYGAIYGIPSRSGLTPSPEMTPERHFPSQPGCAAHAANSAPPKFATRVARSAPPEMPNAQHFPSRSGTIRGANRDGLRNCASLAGDHASVTPTVIGRPASRRRPWRCTASR